MFEDKTLVCRECGNEFVFTASEQQFYADKGFQNEPGRCKACRDKRKAANGGFNRSDRPMYDVILRRVWPAHPGALPAPRRSPGLLPCLLRQAAHGEPLVIQC